MSIGSWGYPNGQIPASAMEEAGGVLLKPSTARQCRAWVARCAERGVTLTFNEGYRNLERQQFWLDYWTAHGEPGNAARVGTSSHGYGQAVDFNADAYNAAQLAIITEEGNRFGMLRNIPQESWHRADVGAVTASLDSTPTGSTTNPESRKLMEPTILFGDETGQDAPFIFDPYTAERKRISAHQLNVYRNSRTPPMELTIPQPGFDTMPKVAGTE